MDNFSVSIILPNYNHSKYLNKRLDSILNQIFQDFELIILDDCSTDNSLEILNKYKEHPKVSHFVINKKNSGSTFKQWKKGLSLAKGKYIWIAESDDYCDNSFLDTVVIELEKNGRTVFCYTQSQIIDTEGNILYNNIQWTDSFVKNIWKSDFEMNGEEFVQNYLKEKNVVPNASAVVFRKDSIPKNILTKLEDFNMTGDWLFWSLLSLKGSISFKGKALNYFRTSSQSTRNHNDDKKKNRRIVEEAKLFSELKYGYPSLLDYKFLENRILIKWRNQNSIFKLFGNTFINKKYLLTNLWFVFKYLIAKFIKK